MTLAETATPLDGLASAASVLLIIEASLIILLLAALALLLALSLKWLHDHLMPPVHDAMPAIRGAFDTTDRVTGQIVDVLAEIYGRRRGFEKSLKTFISAVAPGFFDGDTSPAKSAPGGPQHAPASDPLAPTIPDGATTFADRPTDAL